MKRLGALVVCCAVCTVARPAAAYRPFDGTDGDVAETHALELEIEPVGVARARSTTFLVAPWMVVNYGFVDRWEIVLEAHDEIGLGDAPEQRMRLTNASLSLKALLREGCLQGEEGLSMAMEFGPLLPGTGDGGAFGAEAALITSMRWPALTVHFNTASLLTRQHQFGVFAGAIVEGPFTWRVRPAVELFTEQDVGRGSLPNHPTYSALAALIFRSSDTLSFDIAGRVARIDGQPAWEGRMGLTWTFALASSP